MRYKAALVAEGTVTSDANISSDSLPEYFYAKDVSDYFLRLPFNIRMYKGNVVIASDNISKCG